MTVRKAHILYDKHQQSRYKHVYIYLEFSFTNSCFNSSAVGFNEDITCVSIHLSLSSDSISKYTAINLVHGHVFVCKSCIYEIVKC